jgi:flagellar hook protein FlgE
MTILNASVSGMQANSNWLSTISQNVANANTTGYKNQETDFSTIVDQVSNVGSDGGGVTTSTRSLNALQGNIVSSQTSTNLAVQGSGYFVVSDGSGATYLTRNGSFGPDASGNLVNSAGYYLMAANVLDGSPSVTPANSLDNLVKVNVVNAGQKATPTTSGSITANLPSSAATVAAADLPSLNSASSTSSASTSLVVYDNLGAAHTIDLHFAKTGTGTWEIDAYDSAAAAAGGGFPYSSGPLVTSTLNFSATGALTSGSPLSFTIPGGQTMSIGLDNLTQLASSFNVSAATANGNAPSSLSGVSIGADGTLSFNYTNGTSTPAYDIPLANVESPDNLSSVSGNAFMANSMSGPIYLATTGSTSSALIKSSSLESSTVDLATELTQMIEAQSAYQANSKVFQTGANILDVLNNLKA